MLNRSASLAMSTSVLKALPGKLDIKRHSPSILYTPTRLEQQRATPEPALQNGHLVRSPEVRLCRGGGGQIFIADQTFIRNFVVIETQTLFSSDGSLLTSAM